MVSLKQREPVAWMGRGGEHHVTCSFFCYPCAGTGECTFILLQYRVWCCLMISIVTSASQNHLSFQAGYLPLLQVSETILLIPETITYKDRRNSKPVKITISFHLRYKNANRPPNVILHASLETPSSLLPQDKLSHGRAEPLSPPPYPCTSKGP